MKKKTLISLFVTMLVSVMAFGLSFTTYANESEVTQNWFKEKENVYFSYETKSMNGIKDSLSFYTNMPNTELELKDSIVLSELTSPFLIDFSVPNYELHDNVGGETVVESNLGNQDLLIKFIDSENSGNRIELTLWGNSSVLKDSYQRTYYDMCIYNNGTKYDRNGTGKNPYVRGSFLKSYNNENVYERAGYTIGIDADGYIISRDGRWDNQSAGIKWDSQIRIAEEFLNGSDNANVNVETLFSSKKVNITFTLKNRGWYGERNKILFTKIGNEEFSSYSSVAKPLEDYLINEYMTTPADIITDPEILSQYDYQLNQWFGCPSIVVSEKGRHFIQYFTGGFEEPTENNFIVLEYSDDGVNFSPLALIKYPLINGKNVARPVDSQLQFVNGKLIFFFCQTKVNQFDKYYNSRGYIWGLTIENYDAEDVSEITFTTPKQWCYGGVNSDMTVLSNGRWILTSMDYFNDHLCYVYYSDNQGESWTEVLLNSSDTPWGIDEAMIVETTPGNLHFICRYESTVEGGASMRQAFSTDYGQTWTKITETTERHFEGADSRAYYVRTPNNNLLLINHYRFDGEPNPGTLRKNLCAFLSTDNGATYSAPLLIDGRNWVSYPDVSFGADGSIYVIYDRERYGARELITAHFTEEDILSGNTDNIEKTITKKINYYTSSDRFFTADENGKAEILRGNVTGLSHGVGYTFTENNSKMTYSQNLFVDENNEFNFSFFVPTYSYSADKNFIKTKSSEYVKIKFYLLDNIEEYVELTIWGDSIVGSNDSKCERSKSTLTIKKDGQVYTQEDAGYLRGAFIDSTFFYNEPFYGNGWEDGRISVGLNKNGNLVAKCGEWGSLWNAVVPVAESFQIANGVGEMLKGKKLGLDISLGSFESGNDYFILIDNIDGNAMDFEHTLDLSSPKAKILTEKGTVGEKVTLDYVAYDVLDKYLTYELLVTDKDNNSIAVDNLSFTPTTQGVYTLTLKVSDRYGHETVVTKDITIEEKVVEPPVTPDPPINPEPQDPITPPSDDNPTNAPKKGCSNSIESLTFLALLSLCSCAYLIIKKVKTR